MQKKPFISVLMPVYNAEKYLVSAIESTLMQTYKNFEFIIINDGSRDKSEKIIHDYAKADRRICFVTRENKGLIFTLNQGLELAKGDYIARMDADDINCNDRFEKQVAYLVSHPKCVAVGTKAQLIDNENDDLCFMGDFESHEKIDSSHIKGIGGMIIHPSAMIVKKAMISIGGYSDNYPHAEDVDFWLRLAEYGELANLPEVLFKYRQHVESVGYRHRLTQIESVRKAVRDACIRRGIDFDPKSLVEREFFEPNKCDIYNKWAWWALRVGNKKTARKYALKSILSSPLKLSYWKTLICSIRGY
jgi:glycosyltransferase involved in cell wall biosynthesis